MTPIIELNKVTKIYPMGDVEVHAMRGVDLTISEGEFVAIVGHSGSGKSTLMHIIGLLDHPTTGEVFLSGKNVVNMNETQLAELRNKHIGFIFQAFNLLPKTTAVDNVSLPMLYANIPTEERRVRAIRALTEVGLGTRLDHFPSQLSGGQQQRVAVARALVNHPKLILADEPTGNLDTTSGEEIMQLLRDLNNQGNTIVLVTHELDIAEGAKRIVTIRDGEIVSDKLTKNHA
jgi:putative ABC transport system ATP-binding protein